MNYYKDKHDVECLHEEEFDNLFIKNKSGQVFLVNKTRAYATKHQLRVVYETDDGKVIVVPSSTQKRRVNRIIQKERESARFLNHMRWMGEFRRTPDTDGMSRPDDRSVRCSLCGQENQDGKKKKK